MKYETGDQPMAINYGKPLPMLPKREGKQNGRQPNPEPEKPTGRPHSGKKVVSLRLDPDVIEKFRATGPGWQALMNHALRKAQL
jgi:uncharacterized protein (DUF4415 family)